MFKKLLFHFLVAVIALAVLFISINKVSTPAKAVASIKITPTVTALPSPTGIPEKIAINYSLPYPGVLPDSGLYKLKMIRDRIKIFLTSGNIEKAKLFLLYADKRIAAGKVLIDGNKIELGITTLTKGEKYFEQSLSAALLAKNNKEDLGMLPGNLVNASLKYEEIINELLLKADPGTKPSLQSIADKIKILQQEALNLKN